MGKCFFAGKRRFRRAAWRIERIAFVVAAVLSAFPVSSEIVRSKGDMRLWETVEDRSAPLEWPWEAGADSATLSFSNRLTKTVSSIDVPRNGGEPRGNCSHPITRLEDDGLVDVTLVQKSGANEVGRESATLAYVPGAGGGPITIRVMGTRDWRVVRKSHVVAFDPAWQNLPGDSGYDIAWALHAITIISFR